MNKPSLLRESLAQMVLGHGSALCKIQQPSGAFRDEESGYTLYGQYAGYVCAWLWTTLRAQGDERAKFLDAAIRGWNFYQTQIRDTGKVAVITFDHYWSDAFDEWGFYYWMETRTLLDSALGEETQEAWDASIHRIGHHFSAHLRDHVRSREFEEALAAHNVANHFVWSLLALYRYGIYAKNADLCAEARVQMERVIAAQLPCGTWLEGGSAVIGYGDVTACALSLFAERDAHEGAFQAVRRHFEYVRATLFSDFSRNDCIDGRYWYSRRPFPYVAPSLHRFPGGHEYLRRWIGCVAALPRIAHSSGLSLQGLTVMTGLIPFLPDEIAPKDEAALVLADGITRWPEISCTIRRERGWTVTQCAQISGRSTGRWIFERQNLVSVFKEGIGLVVGGGHSIGQPEFSCFNVIHNGCVCYLHEACEPVPDRMRLRYGDVWCELRVRVHDESHLELLYVVDDLPETARAVVNLPLWLPDNRSVPVFKGIPFPLAEMEARSLGIPMPQGGLLQWRGLCIHVPEGAALRYPVDGYSPYRQASSSDALNRRQGILQIQLSPQRKDCAVHLSSDKSPKP